RRLSYTRVTRAAAQALQQLRAECSNGDAQNAQQTSAEGPAATTHFMPPLTLREQQVLEQVARGASSKEIARALNLGLRLIGVYRSRLLHKVGGCMAVDLVRQSLSVDEEKTK